MVCKYSWSFGRDLFCLFSLLFFFIHFHLYLVKFIISFLLPGCGFSSVSSVAQSCPTLCDHMNHSRAGLPVHHQPPEYTQTHVLQVGDAIQPSQPLSSPSSPSLNLFWHQGLFKRLGQLLRKIPPSENWEWEKGIFLIHEKPCIQNTIEEIIEETN